MERYGREYALQQGYQKSDPWSHGGPYNSGFIAGPSAPYDGAGAAMLRNIGGFPPPFYQAPLQVPPLSMHPLPQYLPLRGPSPQPQPFLSPPLPPHLSLQVPPLSMDFQHSAPPPMRQAPTVCSQPSYTRPGTAKVEGPRPGMWLPLLENRGPALPDQRIMYPLHVKPEPDVPVVVKEEVKVEKDLFYEDNMYWSEDEEEGTDDLALGGHICDTMIVHGECRCNDSSTKDVTALPRPPPLDLRSLAVLDVKHEPEVIDLTGESNSPISIGSSPPTSPFRTASEQLSDLVSASQARDARLAANGKAVPKIEPKIEPDVSPTAAAEVPPVEPESEPDVSPTAAAAVSPVEPEVFALLGLPAVDTSEPGLEGAIVPVSIPYVETAVRANGSSLDSQPPHGQDKGGKANGKSHAAGKASETLQRSASKKRKASVGNELVAPNGNPLDELISLGKLDSAIRLPKLELDGVLVQDPHRENVAATRDSFDRLRVAIQLECQERRLLLRRPDLKAARVLRQKGLWLNFNNVIGAIQGVRVGDAFPFRIMLCVLGLHRHIRAGIGYVPEKDSVYKKAYATSVVLGKDKVYKDDIDNGERVEYTGQGGLVMKKKDAKLSGATPTDQKLVRGNLALDNSHNLCIPIRVMRGHSCLSSPSGVLYTYDGLYMIVEVQYVQGLDGRMVYKFILQRLKDQEPLVPFAADAVPLQAVPRVSEDSLRIANF